MRIHVRTGIATLGLSLLLGGCAAAPPAREGPELSLAELRAIAREANVDAEPYALGTGDRLGAGTYGIYLRDARRRAAATGTAQSSSRTAADAR